MWRSYRGARGRRPRRRRVPAELFAFTQYVEITLLDLGRPGDHLCRVVGYVDVAPRGRGRFRGMAESLAMEVIANNLFNDRG